MDSTASPRAARLGTPSWLDVRLVTGVLLVLVSVLVGAKVLSSADRSSPVWVAARDLAPGTVLAPGDLQVGRARLFDRSARYVAAGERAPAGYLLRRGIGAGELLPYGALAPVTAVQQVRDVSVPVPAGHLPADLRRGEQVDVYVTAGSRTSGGAVRGVGPAEATPARRVLAAVDVASVRSGTGLASSAQDQPVVLAVAPEQVLPLVEAMGSGRIDLVRVPRGAQQTPPQAASATARP